MIGSIAKGARASVLSYTWRLTDNSVKDLTGRVLTGVMRDEITQAYKAIAGTLAVSAPGTNGVFTWTLAAADVNTAGVWLVQFTATAGGVYDATIADYLVITEYLTP